MSRIKLSFWDRLTDTLVWYEKPNIKNIFERCVGGNMYYTWEGWKYILFAVGFIVGFLIHDFLF